MKSKKLQPGFLLSQFWPIDLCATELNSEMNQTDFEKIIAASFSKMRPAVLKCAVILMYNFSIRAYA